MRPLSRSDLPPDLPTRIVPAGLVERIEIDLASQRRIIHAETNDDLIRIGRDPSTRSYIATVRRPGVCYFATYLEYTSYPPDEPARNRLFQVRNVLWDDLPYMVCSIPSGDGRHADRAALRAELRIVDASPAHITGEGIAFFPAQGPNCFSLESASGGGIYRGRPDIEAALGWEQMECAGIHASYSRGRWHG